MATPKVDQKQWDKHVRAGVSTFQGVHFVGVKPVDPTRQKKSLLNVKFIDCKFQSCKFGKAALYHLRFEDCEFEKTSFEEAKIHDVTFATCRFERSSLYRSELSSCMFTDTVMLDTTFSESSSREVEMVDCELVECAFANAQAKETEFKGGRWERVHALHLRTYNVSFSGLKVDNSKLTFSKHTSCTFYQCEWSHTTFKEAVFKQCDLRKSEWKTCGASYSKFEHTKFVELEFAFTDFSDSDFEGSEMTDVTFKDCYLNDAKNLSTVTATGIQLINTTLVGSYWEKNPPAGVQASTQFAQTLLDDGMEVGWILETDDGERNWKVTHLDLDKPPYAVVLESGPNQLRYAASEHSVGYTLMGAPLPKAFSHAFPQTSETFDFEHLVEAIDWAEGVLAGHVESVEPWEESERPRGERSDFPAKTMWEHGPEYEESDDPYEHLKPKELREGPIPEVRIPEPTEEEKQAFAEAVAEYSKLGGSQASFTEEQMERWRRLSPEIYENPRSAKALMGHCQLRWEIYDAKPTKKNLMAFGKCIGRMKATKSARVKQERRRALRAFRKEMRDNCWKMPKKDPTQG
jgi:uncharacterized protein YjbI with pentapeptide repeats